MYRSHFLALSVLAILQLQAVTLTVTTAGDGNVGTGGTCNGTTGDLRGCLNYINNNSFSSTNYAIIFQLSAGNETINVNNNTTPGTNTNVILPLINLYTANTITINGLNNTGAGSGVPITIGGVARGLFLRQGAISISNMNFTSTATGGAGANGGGGGMGAGGGLFIDQASVTLSNVNFTGCSATGGAGGAALPAGAAGGGGGGLGGAGGASPGPGGSGGGGGIGGNGGAGGSSGTGFNGGGGGGGAGGNGAVGGGGCLSGCGVSGQVSGGGGGGGGAVNGANGGIGGSNTNGGAAVTGISLVGAGVTLAGGTGLILGGGGGGAGANAMAGGVGANGGTSGATGGTGGASSGAFGGGGGGGGSTNSNGAAGVAGGAGGSGGNGGGSGGGVQSANNATAIAGIGGGGGGAGTSGTLTSSAGNYGGGSGGSTASGNSGGFGGGGGGGASGVNPGGFGGGGGGSATVTIGSTGGFGGGGGNGTTAGGVSTLGGGSGAASTTGGGGGGAGFGGAIFVNSGGSVTLQGTVSVTGAGVTAGSGQAGGTGGSTAGGGIFIGGNTGLANTLNLNAVNTTDIITIANAIGDDSANSITGATNPGLSLVISGQGAVKLTSTTGSTYSGTTTLNAPQLGIASDSVLGKATSTFVVNGNGGAVTLQATGTVTSPSRPIQFASGLSVTFDTNSNSMTFSGPVTISTSNNITKINPGTLGLANLSAVGALNINGGTLQLSGTNTANSLTGVSGTTLALGSGTLNFGADNSSTAFAGVITGTGAFNKNGTGTSTLSGTSSFTGTTTINNGKISLTGSLSGPVTVNSGGTLGGSGTIGGALTIGSGGTLQPGTSIGTLTVGSLSLNSGSTTIIEISPSASSMLVVNGASTLAGTLNVLFDSGTYASTTYTIVSSGSISGTFGNITFTGAPFIPTATITYNANSAVLNLTVPSTTGGGGGGSSAASAAVNTLISSILNQLTGNDFALAEYLSTFSAVPGYTSLLTALFSQPVSAIKTSLHTINPAASAMNAFTSMNVNYSITNMVDTRLALQRGLHIMNKAGGKAVAALTLSEDQLLAGILPYGNTKKAAAEKTKDNCLWFEGIGDWARQNSQNAIPKLHFQSYGGFIGYDFFGWENGMAGVTAGYTRTSLNFAKNQGSGDINSYTVGPYGTAYYHNGFIELGLFATINQNFNKRNVSFPTFHATAQSNHLSYQLTPHAAIGYDWVIDDAASIILEPFVMGDLVLDWEKGYAESGAGLLDMTVATKTIAMLRSEAGFRAYQVFSEEWGTWLLKEVAGYVNKTPWGTSSFVGAIVGAPNTFTFASFTKSQNILTAGFEALVKGNNGWFGSLAYDGEYFSGYLSNEARATVGVYF